MNATSFMLLSVAGFGIRFAFLEYLGYSSIDMLTSSFDYSQRGLFFLVLVVSSVYAAVYLARITRSTHQR